MNFSTISTQPLPQMQNLPQAASFCVLHTQFQESTQNPVPPQQAIYPQQSIHSQQIVRHPVRAESCAEVESISPWRNPRHVLAPPPAWLGTLADEDGSWALFRFRYKCLLRSRLQAQPLRFQRLRERVQRFGLQLLCDCGAAHCHAPLAMEFLHALAQSESHSRPLRVSQKVVVDSQPRLALSLAQQAIPVREAKTQHERLATRFVPHNLLNALIETPCV